MWNKINKNQNIMEKSEENLDHLVKRFEESKEDFIECEALLHEGYVYILAQKRQSQPSRQKKWYLWIEPLSGKIRAPLFITKNQVEWSYKNILLTSNPSCKEIVVSNDFFFVRNEYYDAHKRLLFDPETNTVFSYGGSEEKKVLCQIFVVE